MPCTSGVKVLAQDPAAGFATHKQLPGDGEGPDNQDQDKNPLVWGFRKAP